MSNRKTKFKPPPDYKGFSFEDIADLNEEALGLLRELCSVKRKLAPGEAKIERVVSKMVQREHNRRTNKKGQSGASNTRPAKVAQNRPSKSKN